MAIHRLLRPRVRASTDDLSANLIPVADDDITACFVERRGRLFASQTRCIYPLPVDGWEQTRQIELHWILRPITLAKSAEKLRHALVDGRSDEQQVRVLDVGTGTGHWVLDLAKEFPDVAFYGLDFVPIATRYPPPNVMFQVHDFTEEMPYPPESFDLVHARLVSLGIADMEAFVAETTRILRPGGLLLTCEWSRTISTNDGSEVSMRAPRACAFLNCLRDLLQARGVVHPSDAMILDRRLTAVESAVFQFPIGGWPEDPEWKAIGLRYLYTLTEYARSLVSFLEEELPVDAVQGLIEGFLQDIHGKDSLVSTYISVHAVRL
ncbi:S-adenosyl-L-methionine-dependent methyltransferase [Trametes cingulata]|nr:S-adenosyl-L-methionine-dependent methyltransferase [Trametes cingulata]